MTPPLPWSFSEISSVLVPPPVPYKEQGKDVDDNNNNHHNNHNNNNNNNHLDETLSL